MTTAAAVGAINFYQRYVSPYKGFRCAYRVLRGRRSCSEFAKRAMRRVGLTGLWPLLRRRFGRCAAAAAVLKSTWGNPDRFGRQSGRGRRKRTADRFVDSCQPDCGDCGGSGTGDLLGSGCEVLGSAADCGGAGDAMACGCDLSP
jgi:putative component of membrane protein insertase Oxa1/YidC/SpoIIIJ protein YidD